MSTLRVRVAARTAEAQDICSYDLVPLDGAALPPFEAGAHIDVYLDLAPDCAPDDALVRQYSLCNAPGETHRYQIAVLRSAASRGGSRGLHDAVAVGAVLRIGRPRNRFPLVPARRTLLLAGGIGVTPLLAMAEALAGAGAQFDLHYFARSPLRAAFRTRIAGSRFAARVHFHYGDAPARPDPASLLPAPDPDTHMYVCGPQRFIDHVVAGARARGWGAAQVHVEYFGAAPLAASGDGAFDVKLASNGRVVTVPAGSTVIEALGRHGVAIPYSCGEGVCGTCLTRVLDGVPDHRDVYLTEAEQAANDQFTPCCSRAKTGLLVLDL